jgi:Domain of unknown function (DUF4268)
MRLEFKRAADTKELFDLIARDRDWIEQEMIGFNLQWLRDRGRIESHIAVERDDMDPRNVTEWERQHTWLSEVVSAFEKVIRPRVERLPPPNVAAYAPSDRLARMPHFSARPRLPDSDDSAG